MNDRVRSQADSQPEFSAHPQKILNLQCHDWYCRLLLQYLLVHFYMPRRHNGCVLWGHKSKATVLG